jgi:hypothetical protein
LAADSDRGEPARDVKKPRCVENEERANQRQKDSKRKSACPFHGFIHVAINGDATNGMATAKQKPARKQGLPG